MEAPPDLLVEQSGIVYKLNKSMYGLKQASRQWYAELTEALCSRGYTHSMFDYSLFYKGCSVMTSPLDPIVKLKAGEGIILPDPSHYRKLIGKLNFLIGTRPDIAYSVQHLSQYMQSPRDSHLKAAVHVLRYLKGNLSLGIFLSNSGDYRVRAFCDSDWATFPETRKSVSGYIVLLGDTLIS
ncbi:uncharacterized mitochondrial protein AtMg00810-like [Nicotiana tomentosiformis]|uniref:uncharacterized mitochondrial protein AtMg00810-like n=1 Tax=Nicotiana tomentosiformis TaxID=4098 RepID=UPI00388C83B7